MDVEKKFHPLTKFVISSCKLFCVVLFQCCQGISITNETNPLKLDVHSCLVFCPPDLFLVKLRIFSRFLQIFFTSDFNLTYPRPSVECIKRYGFGKRNMNFCSKLADCVEIVLKQEKDILKCLSLCLQLKAFPFQTFFLGSE